MSTTPLDKDTPRPRGALDSGHRACQWNAHTHSLQTTWRAQCGSPNASSRAGLHSGKPWVWLAKRPADTGALSTPHAGQRLPASDEQPLQSAQSTPTYLRETSIRKDRAQSPGGTQGREAGGAGVTGARAERHVGDKVMWGHKQESGRSRKWMEHRTLSKKHPGKSPES